MSRVFASGPGDRGSISDQVIPKTQKKWYLVPPCLTLSIIRYGSEVLHTYIYWIHTDAMITDAWQTTGARRKGRMKTSFQIYLPLNLLQGFERLACERMLETERKLHILTPLLWPSRCVFIVLLMLGSTPSGLPYHISSLTLWESAGNCIGGFQGPPQSGVAFPTTSCL